jgi:uncharacterized protein YhhL (DUF1145 family)
MTYYPNPMIMVLPALTVILVFIITAPHRQAHPPTNPAAELVGIILFGVFAIVTLSLMKRWLL